MKANLKGFGGIKGLLLLHGEKLAMVAVGICTLLFIYYSLQLDRLDDKYEVQKLEQEISLTRSSVTDLKWDDAVKDHPEDVRVAKELAQNAAPEIDPAKYPIGTINPPVIRSTQLRTDPPLLAAEDVRVTGGSGLFPILDEKIMNERALARQAAEEQKAKEEAKKAEREQEKQAQGGERATRGRERARGEEMPGYEKDPDHPNRRPVEGAGVVPGAPAQGDERIEQAFWAIVVAKVPIKEQLKLFRDAFENTRAGFNPQYDFPRYVGYQVQRAEVRPGQELQWAPVDVYDGQRNKLGPFIARPIMTKLQDVAATKWAVQMPEPVDPRYLDPEGLLTFPLPPLLGHDWGAEITHPDIPLAINAPPPETETVQAPEQPAATAKEGTAEDVFSQPLDPNAGGIRRPGDEMYGGRGGYRGEVGERGGGFRGFRGGGMAGRGGGMAGRGSVVGPGERGGGTGYRGEGATAMDTLPKGVDSWLLRFFDFSVEPGKKYKYRVRLVLTDPNHTANNPQLPTNTLDSAVLKRIKEAGKGQVSKAPTFRFADWSAPSLTVGIPLSGSVRLAAAKVSTGKLFNDEPSATMLVEAFEKDEKGNAIHAAKEKDLRRGYVANFVEEAEYLGPGGQWIDKIDSFKFLTGITVVDVAGGEKLVKDMQAPSRVLLLDPAGELYIRNEVDDADTVKMHRTLFAKPKKGAREGETPFRGEGGFFRGGRGGRGE